MRTPKLLMLAPSCFPPGNPEAFVNANLVSAMLEAGWHVDVLSSPNPDSNWYPESTRSFESVAARTISVKEHNRTITNGIFAALQTFFLSRQIVRGGRWAIPAAKLSLSLAAMTKYDFVLSRSLPPMAHLAAHIVARKTGIPWIANWNDPVPAYMLPEPYTPASRKTACLTFSDRRHFRAIAEKAAWHTFPCERLRAYMCTYIPFSASEKTSVIPHIALNLYVDKGRNRDQFSMLYAGSLRTPRNPKPFLNGVKLFLQNERPNDDFVVRFITDNPEEVTATSRLLGIQSIVRIEQARPYAEMPATLSQAAVLVILEPQMKEGIFLPSKFVDYVQTGRPILAVSPKTGTVADILSTHGGGVVGDCGAPQDISSAISVLYESWHSGSLDLQFGSSKLLRLFEKKAVLGKYVSIFRTLGFS